MAPGTRPRRQSRESGEPVCCISGPIRPKLFNTTGSRVELCDHLDFVGSPTGELVPISGHDPRYGAWDHVAFVASALPARDARPTGREPSTPSRSARAALGSLDSSARQLPNPSYLRRPTTAEEAQSTSALEGTYAPLQAVLAADEAETRVTPTFTSSQLRPDR